MKINTLSYIDKATNWELKPISFAQLTLLVGVSGVGKTRILKSILNLQKISQGTSLNGVKWSIDFSTKSGNTYLWQGEFENKNFLDENVANLHPIEYSDRDKPKIEKERLSINKKFIVDRSTNGIIFNGIKTVKLPQSESVISLLREEELVKDIHIEFSKIIDGDVENISVLSKRFTFDEEINSKLSKYHNLRTIRECNEDLISKLYFIYMNQRDEFNNIAEVFTDVFPHVEEIKVELLSLNNSSKYISLNNRTSLFHKVLFLKIKEKGVENWIDETQLSSGMLRSLLHITELYLCADSSVILIDEFENSLGVNCIDELTSSILSAGRNLQFIITSHHPYIINNIHYSHWKLVTRKAGAVVARDASDFNFEKSKHKAFMQLINLEEYYEGIDA